MNSVPMTWDLPCPWCDYYVRVASNAPRGGEDAADLMQHHIGIHDKTWQDFLWERA